MAKVRLRDLNPAKFLNKLEVDGAGEFGGRLDVNHDTVKLYNSENTNNTYFFVENTSIGNAGIKMKNSQGEFTIIANDRLRFISDDSPTTEVLSLHPDGNVGIGTGSGTDPAARLHVKGGDAIVENGSGMASGLRFRENGTDMLGLKYQGGVSGNPLDIYNFQVGNMLVRIDENGKVGIGTGSSTLSQILEIKSSSQAKLLINRDAANDVELEFKNTEQSWTTGIDRSNSNTYTISTGTSLANTGLRVGTDGKVGIGTSAGTSLSYNLTVQETDQSSLLIGSTNGARALLILDGSANGDGLGGDYAYLAHEADGRLTIANIHTGNVISLSGKVGINTGSNTVTEGLEINAGNILLSNIGLNKYGIKFGEGSSQTMALRYDGVGSNGHLEIVDSSDNQRLVVDHGGYTGVGVDPGGIGANVATLNVNGGGLFNASVCLRKGLTNSNYSLFETNGETLTISNVGTGTGTGDGHIILNTSRNVGVGTFSGTEPEYNLHVEGTLYANTISVGSGFNDLINAGQLTARKNISGETADSDAALVIEQNINPILEFLTTPGGNGTINFSSSVKGVAAIKVELPGKMQFWAGEALQLTLNQSGSNNVTFSRLGAGTVQSDADGNISVSSSESLKTDIKNFESGLSNIINLRPVKFKWKEETGLDHLNNYVGFIAEEVEKELPDAVICPGECCENGEMIVNEKPKGLSDRAIIAALVNAVQELNQKIEQLENN